MLSSTWQESTESCVVYRRTKIELCSFRNAKFSHIFLLLLQNIIKLQVMFAFVLDKIELVEIPEIRIGWNSVISIFWISCKFFQFSAICWEMLWMVPNYMHNICQRNVRIFMIWKNIFIPNYPISNGKLLLFSMLRPYIYMDTFDLQNIRLLNDKWLTVQSSRAHIQSSAVITRSNIVRYCINDYRNRGRISIRCWIHKIQPIPRPNGRIMGCLLWIFVRK